MPKGRYWETFFREKTMMGKININRLSGPDPIRAELQRDVKGSAVDTGLNIEKRAPVSEDKLDISGRASEVGRLVDQLKAMPDVRQARVDALKEMVAAGSYNPTASDIADAILKND